MPFYDLSAAAEALDVSRKQLDNVICRNTIPGIQRQRRGVTRRLSVDAVVTIRLAFDLVESLGLAISAALRLSQRLREQPAARVVPVGECAVLSLDLDTLLVTTGERLDAAVEAVGRRRRGRPPVHAR